MLDIKVSAALLGFSQTEQRKILDAVYGGDTVPTARLEEAVKAVLQIIDEHEEVVEGYAGFPIEKELIQKNKDKFKDDRNIGRVISQGGQSMVITGMKSDGRYQVVGKKGEKTAKDPSDLGLNLNREHVDIDDLHNQMVEGLKQARKNVGASTCWDGYKAKGTKKKNGKEVPNCVKEEDQIDELYKGKHGQSEKEYQDGRSQGGKMVSGDSKMSGAKYTHGRRVDDGGAGPQPAGGSKKPKAQGKMDKGGRAELQMRKANLKKEEVESIEEKKKGLWANIHAKRKRGERPAKPGEKDYPKTLNIESFGIDYEDDAFDQFSYEELHDICVEALQELDDDLLVEALDIIDGIELLTEAPSKDSAFPNVAVQAPKKNKEAKNGNIDAGAEARKRLQAKQIDKVNARKDRMKAALKSAGSAVKKGLKTAGKAAATGAGYAAGVAGRAARSGASSFKKGYDRGSGGSSRSVSASSGDTGSSSSSSSGSSGGSDSNRPRLRDKIKSGIKKAVGAVARGVSRGSRNLARRMSEERYDWRKELGIEE